MKIRNYRKLKHLLLLGLIIAPAITTTPIILVQKLDKKYLLFDNKIFSSDKALNNYLTKNQVSSFTRMNAKSYYFDNQIFNTDQQFHEYLTNKFTIDEKLTNKIPGNYTIDGAGELSRQVLLDDNDQAVKIYKGKNGVAYQNRKEALDTFNNYHKIYTFEGKEFNTPYEVQEYLKNFVLKKLEDKNTQKELVYENGGVMQSEAEIKTWLRQNLKNGFEYQGKIFSDYNYKEFLTYFQNLDENLIEENINNAVNADKSAYWLKLDANNNEGYFIGPKYVETSSKLPSIINDNFQTIDSFTPDLFSAFICLSVFNNAVSLDYTSKMQNSNQDPNEDQDINWDFNQKSGLQLYIDKLEQKGIITEEIKGEIYKLLFDDNLPYLKQIVDDSTANLKEITNHDEFTDFHRLMIIMKRIMVPARIYSGINTVEIERVLKELLIQVVTTKGNVGSAFDLRANLENSKLEEIIDLFLNPADFYQTNADKQSTLAIVKKADGIINGLMDGIAIAEGPIDNKIKELEKTYQGKNKDDTELSDSRNKLNETIAEELVKPKNINKIKEKLGIYNNGKNQSTLSNAPFGAGLGALKLIKWISIGWELLNTFNFTTIKTLEYKIDQYQSIYYVAPTFKAPLINIEANVKTPTIPVLTLSRSPLDYMLPKTTNDKGEPTPIFELEGKYYLSKQNAINELRSKIYLHPEKYIPCKIIFTSIFEKDEGYQLPDWLANAKIQKKPSDVNKEGTISNGDYILALESEKDKYVDRLFARYFANKGVRYYLDGFGVYFANKEEARESLETKLANSALIEAKSVYLYEPEKGKKFIFKTEQEVQDFILKNELVEEKTVMSTDLIKTAVYDEITSYSNLYFSIYELDFYGDKKYFMSTIQLWTYLLNNLDYKTNYYKLNLQNYSYKGNNFKSEDEFTSWIRLNTQLINSFETKGKEVIGDE